MFAKRAKFPVAPNRWRARETAAPCNDNRPPRRTPRPVLFCRWHGTPSGALECSWTIEAAAAEEAEISWVFVPRMARR